MLIRRARAEDWQAVRDLRLEALTVAPMAFGSTLAQEQDRLESDWVGWIATAHLLGAFDDDIPGTADRAVGMVSGIDRGEGSMAVYAMYVTPAARGSGLAHRLLDGLAAACRSLGGHRLVLDVTEPNLAALAVYLGYGFTPTGRTKPLPHAPDVEEIEMAVDIGRR